MAIISIGIGAVLMAVAKFAIAALLVGLSVTLVFLFTDWFDIVMNFALNKMASTLDIQGQVLEFTDTAAYFAQQLRFRDCLSFIMGAVLAKWLLRKIPFIRW